MNEEYRLPASVATSGPIDFEAAWRSIVDDERNRWTEPETEYAFWEKNAADYEEQFVGDPEGLGTLDTIVEETDSVLEIGPGTGRYTRELAHRADHVTAVEDAPAMARELTSSLAAAGFEDTVDIVTEPWPDATVESHDVVVAAWSLYRQPDIGDCLDRILEVARDGFVLIDSPGSLPPHRRLAVERGVELATPPPRHAYYCGLLADRGVYPSVRIETKTRERRADTRDRLLEELLADRFEADGEETLEGVSASADALSPWLESDEDGWCYRYTMPAAIIAWERGGDTELDSPITSGRSVGSR